jgi:hypothetical protein
MARYGYHGTVAEPTLDDVAREFPAWRVSRAISGLYLARLQDPEHPVTVQGEDPLDLRDQIRRAEARRGWSA